MAKKKAERNECDICQNDHGPQLVGRRCKTCTAPILNPADRAARRLRNAWRPMVGGIYLESGVEALIEFVDARIEKMLKDRGLVS